MKIFIVFKLLSDDAACADFRVFWLGSTGADICRDFGFEATGSMSRFLLLGTRPFTASPGRALPLPNWDVSAPVLAVIRRCRARRNCR